MEPEKPKKYDCIVCKGILEHPVEFPCCNTVLCLDCWKMYDGFHKRCIINCPKYNRKYNERIDVQNELENTHNVLECRNTGCTEKFQALKLNEHEQNACKFKGVPCKWCHAKLQKSELLEHSISKHQDQMLQYLCDPPASGVKNSETVYKSILKQVADGFYPSQALTNERGHRAQRGTTGRLYCGKSRGDTQSCSCDGRCGPNNGCSCVSCMKLDLQVRGMLTGDCLLNYEGGICKVVDGFPFCGRRLQRNTELYCSMDRRCSGCEYLYNHEIERYRSLLF